MSPKTCCVPGCKSRKGKYDTMGYYRIPDQQPQKSKWMFAIFKNPEYELTTKSSSVCGAHFISGMKSTNPDHPDYAPSIFNSTSAKKMRELHYNYARFRHDQDRQLRRLNSGVNTLSHLLIEKRMNWEGKGPNNYGTYYVMPPGQLQQHYSRRTDQTQQVDAYIDIDGQMDITSGLVRFGRTAASGSSAESVHDSSVNEEVTCGVEVRHSEGEQQNGEMKQGEEMKHNEEMKQGEEMKHNEEMKQGEEMKHNENMKDCEAMKHVKEIKQGKDMKHEEVGEERTSRSDSASSVAEHVEHTSNDDSTSETPASPKGDQYHIYIATMVDTEKDRKPPSQIGLFVKNDVKKALAKMYSNSLLGKSTGGEDYEQNKGTVETIGSPCLVGERKDISHDGPVPDHSECRVAGGVQVNPGVDAKTCMTEDTEKATDRSTTTDDSSNMDHDISDTGQKEKNCDSTTGVLDKLDICDAHKKLKCGEDSIFGKRDEKGESDSFEGRVCIENNGDSEKDCDPRDVFREHSYHHHAGGDKVVKDSSIKPYTPSLRSYLAIEDVTCNMFTPYYSFKEQVVLNTEIIRKAMRETAVQTEVEYKEQSLSINLQTQWQTLEQEHVALLNCIAQHGYNMQVMEKDEQKVQFYTGLPNYVSLKALYDYVKPHVLNLSDHSRTHFEAFTLTLMKMRLGIKNYDIFYQTQHAMASLSHTLTRWFDALYCCLAPLVDWPVTSKQPQGFYQKKILVLKRRFFILENVYQNLKTSDNWLMMKGVRDVVAVCDVLSRFWVKQEGDPKTFVDPFETAEPVSEDESSSSLSSSSEEEAEEEDTPPVVAVTTTPATLSEHSKRALSEHSKRALSEHSKRALSAGSKRTLSDGSKRALSACSKRALSDGSKRALSDSSKRALSDSSKRALSDSSKRALSDSSKRALSDSSKRALSAVSKRALSDGSKRTLSDGSKRALSGGSKRTLSDGSNRALSAGSKRVLSDNAKRALSQGSKRVLSDDSKTDTASNNSDDIQRMLDVNIDTAFNILSNDINLDTSLISTSLADPNLEDASLPHNAFSNYPGVDSSLSSGYSTFDSALVSQLGLDGVQNFSRSQDMMFSPQTSLSSVESLLGLALCGDGPLSDSMDIDGVHTDLSMSPVKSLNDTISLLANRLNTRNGGNKSNKRSPSKSSPRRSMSVEPVTLMTSIPSVLGDHGYFQHSCAAGFNESINSTSSFSRCCASVKSDHNYCSETSSMDVDMSSEYIVTFDNM